MDSKIKKIIDDILLVEGEAFTNDPKDSGGATKWGVTQRTASKYGVQDVSTLTREKAFDIYYQGYVVERGFDKVLEIAPLVAAEMIDTTVNGGNPVKWLQDWLNVLNQEQTIYSDLTADGKLGNQTLTALKAFISKRGNEGDAILATALNADQGVYYKNLALSRSKDEKFVFGWLKNRVYLQVKNL